MSTKKPAKVNPEASFSSRLTPEDKKHYDRCLVNSQDGMWYLFSDDKVGAAGIITPRVLYPNWKAFAASFGIDDQGSHTADTAGLANLYATSFGKEATKEMQKDPMELSIMVWMQLCKTAVNRLSARAPEVTAAGNPKRSFKKLLDRGYEIIKLEIDPKLKLPPQAKTCLEFFAELVKEANPSGENRIETIKEDRVKAYVIEQQTRLQTRQDPWRIFQYYRPTLIKEGFIRLV